MHKCTWRNKVKIGRLTEKFEMVVNLEDGRSSGVPQAVFISWQDPSDENRSMRVDSTESQGNVGDHGSDQLRIPASGIHIIRSATDNKCTGRYREATVIGAPKYMFGTVTTDAQVVDGLKVVSLDIGYRAMPAMMESLVNVILVEEHEQTVSRWI